MKMNKNLDLVKFIEKIQLKELMPVEDAKKKIDSYVYIRKNVKKPKKQNFDNIIKMIKSAI